MDMYIDLMYKSDLSEYNLLIYSEGVCNSYKVDSVDVAANIIVNLHDLSNKNIYIDTLDIGIALGDKLKELGVSYKPTTIIYKDLNIIRTCKGR